MFFVSRGKVDAVSFDDITVFYTIYPGEFFGETCLLNQGLVKRECTFRAVNYVDVYMLQRNTFNNIILSSPEFVGAIQFEYNSRKRFVRRESIVVNSNLTNTTSAVKFGQHNKNKIYEMYGSQVKITQVAPASAIIVEQVEEMVALVSEQPKQLFTPRPHLLNFGPPELQPLSRIHLNNYLT